MKLNICDGRGAYGKNEAEKNKRLIVEFFKKNPGSTQKECAESLNLSTITVWKHLKNIRKDK